MGVHELLVGEREREREREGTEVALSARVYDKNH